MGGAPVGALTCPVGRLGVGRMGATGAGCWGAGGGTGCRGAGVGGTPPDARCAAKSCSIAVMRLLLDGGDDSTGPPAGGVDCG
jgi:hypothetical protein